MTGYILYAFLAPLSLLFNLFVIITSPFWAFIAAILKVGEFPYPFSWVHTHDNNIYGGNNIPNSFKERFKIAVWWLCRNPGYGFDAHLLGFRGDEVVDQIMEVKEGEWNYGNAFRFDRIILTNGRTRFSYRRNITLWGNRYIKVWFGWHYFDQAGYRMLKFDINPFKKGN